LEKRPLREKLDPEKIKDNKEMKNENRRFYEWFAAACDRSYIVLNEGCLACCGSNPK